MGLFKFLLGQPSREYSDNVKGKWAEDAWSDIDHRKITDKYYPQMEKIEEQWSIMYNLYINRWQPLKTLMAKLLHQMHRLLSV